MKLFEPEFEQDPAIRRRWFNWKTALAFGSLVVVLPATLIYGLDYLACDCNLTQFAANSGEAYGMLLVKLGAFATLTYIMGVNFIIYRLTKQRRQNDQS